MWIQKFLQDEKNHVVSPIPTQIVSNEEYWPLPQTPEQQRIEKRIGELADSFGKVVGLDRRRFLMTAGGMAAAFLAMNEVFGPYFNVHAAEALDGPMRDEKWPKDQFIFDIQCHHVDVPRGVGKGLISMFRQPAERFNPALKGHKHRYEDLGIENFLKEIFFDSDTVMAVISGVPSREWNKNPLPPDQMAATRDHVNGLAGSERVVAHGLLRPNLGKDELVEMERQVKDLKIRAWKMYTGAELGEQAWWMSDEKVAYPCWEKTRQLGIKNLCVHKGLPLGYFNEEHCHPRDIVRAAKDWPDLNFIVYHSAFRGFGAIARGTGKPVDDPKRNDPQEIPWISDLLRDLRAHPEVKNVYFELGSTFGQTSAFAPITCMHMLGQMLQVVGADRILWGTDSIWGGSPQSQIERLRRLKIQDELIEKHGYPELTQEVKRKILGLNAARLFGIDPEAKRRAIERDRFGKLRCKYLEDPWPSNTQFGWVWQGEGEAPTVPVGA
jgi:predicted TIM-barrel fold metal-dependent hydrolase